MFKYISISVIMYPKEIELIELQLVSFTDSASMRVSSGLALVSELVNEVDGIKNVN